MIRPDATCRARGFSLLELLAVMVIVGLLMSVLGRVMNQVMDNSAMLAERQRYTASAVRLRRMLHRDLQGLLRAESMSMGAQSFTLATTHSLLLPGSPFPVEVTWDFSGDAIVRTEANENIGYNKSIELMDQVLGTEMRLRTVGEKRWKDTVTSVMGTSNLEAFTKSIRGIKLTVHFSEERTMDFVERIPHGELLKED